MFKYSMFVVIFVRLTQSENWVVTENVMESVMEIVLAQHHGKPSRKATTPERHGKHDLHRAS